MSKILDGNLVSKKIIEQIKKQIAELKKKNIIPKFAVILVGDDPASKIYVAIKEKKARQLGMEILALHFSDDLTNYELTREIEKLNNDKSINGIILQLPLPKQFDSASIIETISPQKDADVITSQNLGKLVLAKPELLPPTASAILEILDFYKINLARKKIVIVGYGKLVGKPLSILLNNLKVSAAITICDTKTKNLAHFTEQADIVISATGVPNLIRADMVKKNSVIIDAGTVKIKDKIVGDVDFKNVSKKTKFITPSIGGVGPVTVAKLLNNIVILAQKNAK